MSGIFNKQNLYFGNLPMAYVDMPFSNELDDEFVGEFNDEFEELNQRLNQFIRCRRMAQLDEALFQRHRSRSPSVDEIQGSNTDNSSLTDTDSNHGDNVNEVHNDDCEGSLRRRTRSMLNTENVDTNKKFICALCNKKIKTKGWFRTHMRQHINPKRHPCPICKITFTRKSNVKRHISKFHKK